MVEIHPILLISGLLILLFIVPFVVTSYSQAYNSKAELSVITVGVLFSVAIISVVSVIYFWGYWIAEGIVWCLMWLLQTASFLFGLWMVGMLFIGVPIAIIRHIATKD